MFSEHPQWQTRINGDNLSNDGHLGPQWRCCQVLPCDRSQHRRSHPSHDPRGLAVACAMQVFSADVGLVSTCPGCVAPLAERDPRRLFLWHSRCLTCHVHPLRRLYCGRSMQCPVSMECNKLPNLLQYPPQNFCEQMHQALSKEMHGPSKSINGGRLVSFSMLLICSAPSPKRKIPVDREPLGYSA